MLQPRRQRQEDQKFKTILGYNGEFEASLGYSTPCLKKQQQQEEEEEEEEEEKKKNHHHPLKATG